MEVDSIPILLITANVGSVFEDPPGLLNSWIKEFLNKIALVRPQFLALHLQEVGGKTYEKSMEHVQEFIKILCESDELSEYNRIRIYLDEDYNSAEHFTALGNLYFVHQTLQTVKIWNFLTHEWETADGKSIHTGNIEAIATKEKAKFPQHFFPECKWSRKGFLRTRWELQCTVIDLVNIHLFHDASNLAACEEFPSVYCKTRRRALVHSLERFHTDHKNGIAPYFIFGDFNFRCDTEGVVKKLTEDLTTHRIQNAKNDSTKMHYRNSEGENVLVVGKKEFMHNEHQIKFKESWLQKFDRELETLREILVEFPITFPPSYPYEENPEMPKSYMSTRCPSWCDRILMNPTARELILDETFSSTDYNIIGENVCMGDHKPIYLSVNLKTLQGTNEYCKCFQQHQNNQHANSYKSFSSFLLNYHKVITSQISNNHNNYLSQIIPNASNYCLYFNKHFIEILLECNQYNINNNKRLNSRIDSLRNLHQTKSSLDSINKNLLKKIVDIEENQNDIKIDTIESKSKEENLISKQQQLPLVSINITNIDDDDDDDIIDDIDYNICMCSEYLKENENIDEGIVENNSKNNDNNFIENRICPQCQNIIKSQSIEPRRTLISKRLMLSNNIIVNRIDTQFLNTSNFLNNRFEPYTPESAESHSPCPELDYDIDTNISQNLNNDLLTISQTNINSQKLLFNSKSNTNYLTISNDSGHGSSSAGENQISVNDNDQNNFEMSNVPPTIGIHPIDKRGIVSPTQLKTRLEILQRKSLENDNKDNRAILKHIKDKEKTSCSDKCCAIS